MTRKLEIRMLVTAGFLVLSAFSLFGVLHAEERKRLRDRESEITDFLLRLQVSGRARQEYYDGLISERARLREQMDVAEARYGELTVDQSGLVDAARQETTRIVEETVPIQVPVSTRSTKTS